MSAVLISRKLFEELGDNMINRGIRKNNPKSKTFDRRYKTWFGISPLNCALLWWLLVKIVPGFEESSAEPHHLLWGLLFLKTYATECVSASQVGGVDEKTLRFYM